MVKRRIDGRKFADIRLDYQFGDASLNVWERQFSLFPIGAKQYLVVMAQSDKGLQTEPEKLLCVVRIERRREPGSNEPTNESLL